MTQYVYTMHRVGKLVPPKRQILKDISLSFFPGAKIGILGLNGSGKSSLLRIMAGVDTEYRRRGEAAANLTIGYLEQEPKLDPEKTVRETVEEALGEVMAARKRLDEIYAAYGEPDADFEKLADEQAKLEAVLFVAGRRQTSISSWRSRRTRCACRRGTQRSGRSRAARSAASRSAGCCFRSRTCCCSTSRPITSMRKASSGSSNFCSAFRAPSSP